jgi:hypothetical protein
VSSPLVLLVLVLVLVLLVLVLLVLVLAVPSDGTPGQLLLQLPAALVQQAAAQLPFLPPSKLADQSELPLHCHCCHSILAAKPRQDGKSTPWQSRH